MSKNEFLNNILKYYDLALRIDNVIGIKYKKTEIPFKTVILTIDKKYQEKQIKGHKFYLDSNFRNNFLPIEYLNESSIERFIEEVSYFEKSIRFEGQKLKKENKLISIHEHPEFVFSKESNYFQYGIAFNLIKEKPFSNYSKYVPSFVILFPNYDDEFQFLTPDKIFIEIKRFLGYKLNENEEEFSCEYTPYLVFNSKLLEPYSLDTPNIKLSNFEQTQKDINEFLKPILESDKYSLEKNFKYKSFIIGISQNLNMGLTKIYNSIFEHQNINNLLKSYFQINKRKKNEILIPEIDENEIMTTKKIVDSYSLHYGSFDKEYPLAQTQREALSCYLENKEILPVNGAPGTGKTSLLRGIFGDYTVKSALKSYDGYVKEKVVLFNTPIVCSSTNNQALTNVSEGIDLGFFDMTKNNSCNLYKRWLDNVKLEKKNINFRENMFVPSIRTKVERKYELTKSDMLSVGTQISKKPLGYLNEYFKYRNIDIRCEKVDKRTLEFLNKAAHFFYTKIKENINEINQNEISLKSKINKLSKLEVDFITKYIRNGIQEDLIKAILHEIKVQSQNKISYFKKYKAYKNEYNQILQDKENLLSSIQTNRKLDFDIENSVSSFSFKIETLNNRILEESTYINDYECSPIYDDCYIEVKSRYNNKFQYEEDKLKEILKKNIKKVFKEANILEKITYGIFKKGNIKQKIDEINFLSQKQINELSDKFYQEDFFINDLAKSIIDRHRHTISNLESELSKLEIEIEEQTIKRSELKLRIFQFEKDFDDKDVKQYIIEKKLDEEFGVLSNDIFELDDVEKLIEFETVYKELNVLNEKNKEYDTNQRTDNFYFALHLLEALYFIDNTNMWNSKLELNNFDNKVIKCSICNKGTMIQNNNLIKCSCCKRKFSFNNPYLPKELKEDEDKILYILKHGKATIDDSSYYVNAADDFINISTNNNKDNEIFKNLYPLFPIVNITCNSFGTIVSQIDSTEIKEDIFDFLLIDEAATIPPSKMIILNCAKRVMFFGDTKQLKPVFAYDTDIENRILEDFFPKEREIKYIGKYFSCASKVKNEPILKKNNNAMDIANSAVNYFLPYNKSKMEGDIWLKEHFRCQTPIIQISNEISYFNEILPMKKDKYPSKAWSTLLLFNHEEEKSSNNTNLGEVKNIVKFIRKNKEKYINDFLKTIKEKIGRASCRERVYAPV